MIKYYIEKFLFEKFKIGGIQTELITKIDNKIVTKKFAKSFVANFLHILYTFFSNTGGDFDVSPISGYKDRARDSNGTWTTLNLNSVLRYNVGGGNDARGIVLSQDTTPVTPNDYQILNKITHGTGANQLQYLSMSGTGTNINGSICYLDLSRTFINQSGSSIDVKKIYILDYLSPYIVVFSELVNDTIPNLASYNVVIRISINV